MLTSPNSFSITATLLVPRSLSRWFSNVVCGNASRGRRFGAEGAQHLLLHPCLLHATAPCRPQPSRRYSHLACSQEPGDNLHKREGREKAAASQHGAGQDVAPSSSRCICEPPHLRASLAQPTHRDRNLGPLLFCGERHGGNGVPYRAESQLEALPNCSSPAASLILVLTAGPRAGQTGRCRGNEQVLWNACKKIFALFFPHHSPISTTVVETSYLSSEHESARRYHTNTNLLIYKKRKAPRYGGRHRRWGCGRWRPPSSSVDLRSSFRRKRKPQSARRGAREAPSTVRPSLATPCMCMHVLQGATGLNAPTPLSQDLFVLQGQTPRWRDTESHSHTHLMHCMAHHPQCREIWDRLQRAWEGSPT